MAIPTITWDEGNPSGTQQKSLGGTRIRELKTQFREIFAVDHNMDSSGSDTDWGYHTKCTLYNRAADSLPGADTGCLFAKDVSSKSEWHWVDEDDNVIQITSGGSCTVGIPKEVRMWSGLLANIPSGWYLCDGNNSTPNMIAKFVRGINTNVTDPTNPGGSDTVTLDVNNVPAHTHTSTALDGTHAHAINAFTGAGFPDSTVSPYGQTTFNYRLAGLIAAESAHTHATSSVGSGTAYTRMPVYLELAFIMKG